MKSTQLETGQWRSLRQALLLSACQPVQAPPRATAAAGNGACGRQRRHPRRHAQGDRGRSGGAQRDSVGRGGRRQWKAAILKTCRNWPG